MTCVICRHGKTHPGTATVTLEHDGSTLVFQHVPALICDNCGEEYVDAAIGEHLFTLSAESARANVHLSVREYTA